MLILTKDGNALELSKKDRVEFSAGTYVGHLNFNVYIVEARFRPQGTKYSHVTVCLGEYKEKATAFTAAQELKEALKQKRTMFTMPENKGVAPADDLSDSLKTAIEFLKKHAGEGGKYEGEFCFAVGTPTGLTNDNTTFGFNPDKNGSYAAALKEWVGRYSDAQVEALSA